MAPSPVTISYEYEHPRYEYDLAVAGDRETVEANWCCRRDGRFVFVEVTDIVPTGTGARLDRTEVFDCEAAAVDAFETTRVGETVLEVQFIRRPSLLAWLAPWRWPPTVGTRPVERVGDGASLVHPTDDDPDFVGEVLHSLDAMPEDG
jgi:hypothetical protein